MSLSDELEKLQELHAAGALTDEEFETAKAALLKEDRDVIKDLGTGVGDLIKDEDTYLLCMHLTQLLGYLIPLGGLIVPIAMWVAKKDTSSAVDEHGKMIVNWIISLFLYSVVSGLLCLIVIGFIPLIILGILTVVYPIIGAIKAKEGVLWRYPLTINFL